ncbi:MAG TPA: pirin family protein [Polyangia bacterium]|nr:pirin family protein [Polyangia bacterium]
MPSRPREVVQVIDAQPTIEGAGVHLRRSLGSRALPLLDPFLMLDEFHSNRPEDYAPGFPSHPHRGFETVTYMLDGAVEHRDSLGNHGHLGSGWAQWMTAGHGIIHSEMPVHQPTSHNAFVYVFDGEAELGPSRAKVAAGQLAVLGAGDLFTARTTSGARMLSFAGRPIGEPVARYGPFVMNTEDELRQAVDDYRTGRLIQL